MPVEEQDRIIKEIEAEFPLNAWDSEFVAEEYWRRVSTAGYEKPEPPPW